MPWLSPDLLPMKTGVADRCVKWEKKGATGWGWKAMKPYFHKAEHFTPNPDYDIDNSVSPLLYRHAWRFELTR